MDRDITIIGLEKLLAGQALTENELSNVKNMLTCGIFTDMDEVCRERIINATIDDMHTVFVTCMLDTAKRTLKLRYGI